jgi:tRNA(adenine34) deaminase
LEAIARFEEKILSLNLSWKNLNETTYLQHCGWMQKALSLADTAGTAGEIPVGAVIIDERGELIATGENRRQRDKDPTAHAEIIALRNAGQVLGSWYLNQCTLYVTLEPCPMCAGAILQSRLGLLVYGANEPKSGAIRTVLNLPDSAASNHRLEVISGILESACQTQLQTWFANRRKLEN